MTILNYLKDKLVCPVCGGKARFFGLPRSFGCCAELTYENESDLTYISEWLVLTGGPIPGSVKPPMPMWRRDVKADYIGPYYSHTSWFEDETNLYMLTADERTIEIITEWLQRPMGEGV